MRMYESDESRMRVDHDQLSGPRHKHESKATGDGFVERERKFYPTLTPGFSYPQEIEKHQSEGQVSVRW